MYCFKASYSCAWKNNLNKLNVIQIQQFYRNLTEKLSNSRIILIHRILNTALNQAVAQNLIITNPARFAPKPESTSIQTWTEEEVKLFVTFTKLTISYWLYSGNNNRNEAR